jgi:hypothetical protein
MEIERDWDTGRTDTEEIAFLRDRVAAFEDQMKHLRGSTIVTRCGDCGSAKSNRLADMMDTADALRVATRGEGSDGKV